jgi:hypothetical protein
MAAISLFWYTNMAAVTSDENDLLILSPNVWARSNWFQAVADTQPSTQFMSLYYVCVCVCMFLYSSDGKAIRLKLN